ncbi:hypothetical protein MY1884_001085 [Beauveria asiatica]
MQAAAEPLTLTLDHDSEGENGDDGNDDRSSSPDGSHTSDPDPLQWKSGLESILYEDDSIADVRFADSIAREARNCIRISNDVTTQVNTIKSICILVDYSASKAHGRQAWADIVCDPRNLRMALAVLEALKTFYTPAEDWINILSQAHNSSMRPALTSDDLDLAFCGYFSRFIDIQEPTFVPLDPREKDTPRGAIGTPDSIQSQERCLERNPNNSDLPTTTTSDKNSQKILEEVWAHRDLVRKGQASPESWQDAMQRIGQSQILV